VAQHPSMSNRQQAFSDLGLSLFLFSKAGMVSSYSTGNGGGGGGKIEELGFFVNIK
jgi:hypothetical protein